MKTIGIIGAMEVEVAILKEKMEDVQGDEFRKSSMAELSKKLDDVVWEISNINSW